MNNLEKNKIEILSQALYLAKEGNNTPYALGEALIEAYNRARHERIDDISEVIDWLIREYVEKPILDDTEKEYLGNVVKPFRRFNIKISKRELNGKAQITISVSDYHNYYTTVFTLPPFDKEEMYIGMVPGKEYTLKELGL